MTRDWRESILFMSQVSINCWIKLAHIPSPIWFDQALIVIYSRHVKELMTFPGRIQRYQFDLIRSSGNGQTRLWLCRGSSRRTFSWRQALVDWPLMQPVVLWCTDKRNLVYTPFPLPDLPYATSHHVQLDLDKTQCVRTSRDKLRYVMIDDDGGVPAIRM